MKYFKHCILPLLTLISVMCSCGPNDPEPTPTPDPTPKAPTAVTLSKTSVDAPAEGGTYDITVKSPFDPQVDKPSWVTVSNAKVENYTYTATVVVAAQEVGATAREATLTFKATGATSATLKVSQAKGEDPVEPGEENEATALAKKLGLGWNMGNEMEAHNNGVPDEECWTGVKCTQETFTKVKAAGFSSVRIPVSWMSFIGEAPEYTLDATRLARLKEIVGYAHTADLITIINIHHDGADSKYWLSVAQGADNTAITAKFAAVWKQLAEAFINEGEWLIFESCNEIHDGGWGYSAEYLTAAGKKRQNDVLNGWNQKFVDVVRAAGGNNETRWLGVPGYAANPDFTLNDGFVVPNDPAKRVMVAVHTYGPYQFGQTAEVNEWGHTRTVMLTDPSYNEEFYQDQMSKLYSKWVANNIPVYFGEYGCANRTDSKAYAFQLYFLEYMSKCMNTYRMAGFIWDNGAKGSGNEIYGIIHHGTGAYMDAVRGPEIVKACKKGMTSTDEGYTLESVYNKAPKP